MRDMMPSRACSTVSTLVLYYTAYFTGFRALQRCVTRGAGPRWAWGAPRDLRAYLTAGDARRLSCNVPCLHRSRGAPHAHLGPYSAWRTAFAALGAHLPPVRSNGRLLSTIGCGTCRACIVGSAMARIAHFQSHPRRAPALFVHVCGCECCARAPACVLPHAGVRALGVSAYVSRWVTARAVCGARGGPRGWLVAGVWEVEDGLELGEEPAAAQDEEGEEAGGDREVAERQW